MRDKKNLIKVLIVHNGIIESIKRKTWRKFIYLLVLSNNISHISRDKYEPS